MACVHHPEVEAGLERCARCAGSFCLDCFVVLRDRPWCAACKVELVRDLRSGLVPNALSLASVGRRLLGLWVDSFLTAVASYALLIPIMIPIAALSDPSPGGDADPEALPMVFILLMYPVFFAVPVVYEGFMLQRRGQTLGKMLIGAKVVTPEGGPIGPGQAWGRAALKLVLGSCAGIDYLPALFTRERTCLHDLIARTRVVRLEP